MLASNPAIMVNHISPRRGKRLQISVVGKCSSLAKQTFYSFEPESSNVILYVLQLTIHQLR